MVGPAVVSLHDVLYAPKTGGPTRVIAERAYLFSISDRIRCSSACLTASGNRTKLLAVKSRCRCALGRLWTWLEDHECSRSDSILTYSASSWRAVESHCRQRSSPSFFTC